MWSCVPAVLRASSLVQAVPGPGHDHTGPRTAIDPARMPLAHLMVLLKGCRVTTFTSLEPSSVAVDPGSSETTTVRLRNDSDTVEEYRLSVVGDPAAWTRIAPDTLRLYPVTRAGLGGLLPTSCAGNDRGQPAVRHPGPTAAEPRAVERGRGSRHRLAVRGDARGTGSRDGARAAVDAVTRGRGQPRQRTAARGDLGAGRRGRAGLPSLSGDHGGRAGPYPSRQGEDPARWGEVSRPARAISVHADAHPGTGSSARTDGGAPARAVARHIHPAAALPEMAAGHAGLLAAGAAAFAASGSSHGRPWCRTR